jgi:phosphofructokinase-like protein
MKIGVLTGGGDCPGLNAAIRAIVKKALQGGDSVLGIRGGWQGLVVGNVEPLTQFSVAGILPKGGTILGTSRTNPFKSEESVQKSLAHVRKFGIDALIPIGGEDTLGVARQFSERGLPVVGIPKTIDNDLPGTDYCIGFDTSINIVMEAIDRLHSTAESHHRVMVVEVMGRQSGWIAAAAGIAAGADYILVPEEPYDIAAVCRTVTDRRERGKGFSIIGVAAGARGAGGERVTLDESVDAFGHVRLGGVGTFVSREIERRTGIESRVTILGHVQRGGVPTAYDRLMATRLGLRAVELVRAGRFGRMVALAGGQLTDVPLAELSKGMRTLDPGLLEDAKVFFG